MLRRWYEIDTTSYRIHMRLNAKRFKWQMFLKWFKHSRLKDFCNNKFKNVYVDSTKRHVEYFRLT